MTIKGEFLKKTDILFVRPGNPKQVYGNLSDFELTAVEPPLWSALLCAFLRKKGYGVSILDAEAENLNLKETVNRIREASPSLIVLTVSGSNPSASTMNMDRASELAAETKRELGGISHICLHGLHPSALPKRSLEESASDYVCQGEGFYTLPKLCDAIKTSSNLDKIPGLWYRNKDNVISSNKKAEIFDDLDRLPLPAWDMLPMSKYRAHNWHCFGNLEERSPYGILYTSLGCPYNCTFCCINTLFGKPGIRFRSSSKVIEDIDVMINDFGIRNIKIIDELFAINEKRVVEICDTIKSRNYNLNMWAYARIDTVTPLMLKKMRSAGINWIAYGFESVNERVLKSVNKSYTPNIVDSIVKMTYDEGLYMGANYIFGLPEDDFDSMQQTLNKASEINAHWTNFYPTMAYPGTKLYKEALLKKLPLPENWSGYSMYNRHTYPLPTKHLTSAEVLSFRDYAFQTYYTNPRYLKKILQTFGYDVARHIMEMSKTKLERERKFPSPQG